MEKMEELKKMLCDELHEIIDTGHITLGDLDAVHKMVVTIEKIDRIEEIEGNGYSSDGGWMARGNYSRGGYGMSNRGNSYNGNSYNGNSYRNDSYADGSYRRNAMGQYSRAGEDMGEIIEEMMRNPNTSSKDKETLRKAMDILNR